MTRTHLTSAADLARIGAAFAANPTLMRVAGTTSYDGFGHSVHSTNKLLYDGRFPAIIGGKTGQTDNAGYTLVEIANRNGRLILSVELGTTADAFWTDAMHLLAYGYATPRRRRSRTPSRSTAHLPSSRPGRYTQICSRNRSPPRTAKRQVPTPRRHQR